MGGEDGSCKSQGKGNILWEGTLQKPIDVALLLQKELEKEVSNLTDKAMSISDFYFVRSRENILFFYHNMDLSPMNFLKVVHGSKLVDMEELVSPEFEKYASPEKAHDKGEVKEDCGSWDPQL